MKAWGVTEQDIRDAAAETGVRLHGWPNGYVEQDGRALRFRLAVDVSQPRNSEGMLPYQRISTATFRDGKPRRISAVCWHGHREFLRALFRRNQEARVKTALADYRGADNFEQTFRSTYGQGNDYHLAYGQACGCTERQSENVHEFRQSDIMRCPFFILAPEHYRANGTCKCDDPEEQQRMILEWGYAPEDFAPTAA